MIIIRSAKMRSMLRYLIPALIIPVALLSAYFAEDYYALASVVTALMALLLFAAGFERKQTGSRRLVLVSVITALSCTGRFIPLFKPVTALTVITAMYFGCEAGFLVGALSALISDLFFGIGPWTPFQMLAWGLIGYFAGFISRGLLHSRVLLLFYGIVSGIAFSLIMDVWTVLWYGEGFTLSLYSAAIITALPHTLLYSVSNCLFLLLFARPLGEKLQRAKTKYSM